MFGQYPAHTPDMRGMRPHWLRMALLLLFVVGIFWLPWPTLPAAPRQATPLAGEFAPPTVSLPGEARPAEQPTPLAGEFAPNINPPDAAPPPQLATPLAGEFAPNGADIFSTIRRANAAFRNARAQADLAPLLGLASGDWLDYERGQIARLQNSGITERWSQLSISIREPVFQGAQAIVCTNERWEQATIDAYGNSISVETHHYDEQYTLQQEGETWLVSRIDYTAPQCGV